MLSMYEHQGAAFVRALLDPEAPPPAGLKAWHGGQVSKRFAVYRNNVVGGLIGALEQRFPVCLRLVGEVFFRGMAQFYVRSSLPASPILAEYGADFADFISCFGPARDLAYLPDVARLEWAVGLAYHAADAAPVPLATISSIPPEMLGDATVRLHPSVQFLTSRFPVLSIWMTNTLDETVCDLDLETPEDTLVLRPHLEIAAYRLPRGGYAFMTALARGVSLSEAYAAAADIDLPACLQLLLSSGAIAAIVADP